MSKLCVYCGQDCSAKPRIKDADGHYACKACADAHAAAAAPAPRAQRAPAPTSATPRTPKAAAAAAAPALDDGDVDLSALVAESAKVDAGPQEMRACPNCQASNGSTATECRSCGYNFITRKAPARKGPALPVGVAAKDNCEKCGYAMKGLATPKCPECGHVNSTDVKKVQHERDSKASARAYWLKPIVITAISLPIACGAGMYQLINDPAFPLEAGQAAIIFAASFAVYVVCSFAVYFLLGLFGGFSMSHSLAILGLIAVASATSATGAIFRAVIPLPLIPWILNFFVYCGLASELLDIELSDSWKFGFLCNFATFIGTVIVIVPLIKAVIS